MKRAILITIILSISGCIAGNVSLIKDGKPASEIVISPNAIQGVKLAAEDLQKHLELMSGAKLPIVNAPTPGTPNQIYVGESEFTKKLGFVPSKFNNSAYEILVKDNYAILTGPDKQRKAPPYRQTPSDSIYLKGSIITGKVFPKPKNFPSPGLKAWQDFCGEKFTTQHLLEGLGRFNKPLKVHINDDLCTWYAVSAFLEGLGVRWYMPYEYGTVIPKKKTVSIPEQHIKKEAKFAQREWHYGGRDKDGPGIAWLKRLKAGNYTMTIFNHTTYAIYSSYEQQKSHPEYLACDANGKPYEGFPSGRGRPRYTNPGFRKAAVTYMNKVFDAFPDMAAISIGPPDGCLKMDARDIDLYGKPTDSMQQKVSNYIWDFNFYLANELKKSHPDKKLIYMSSASGRLPPTNMKEFPDNMIVPFAQPYSAYQALETTRSQVLADRQKWFKKMKECGVKEIPKCTIWDYYLYYRYPSNPRYPVVFTKFLQKEIKEMLPYARGKFIETAFANSKIGVPGLMHLMIYWQNKLYWDPDMDRKKMLDEYYTLFFGPAAAEMKEFYEFAEKVWTRQESRSLTETTGFLKEKDVDKYFEILKRAREKAGKDTIYDKRIAIIEKEMQSLKKLFPNLKRTGPTLRAYNAPKGFKIDGNPSEYKYGWTVMRDARTGEKPEKNLTKATVAITPDKSALIIGVVCYENRMNQLKADCKINDDANIFQDDVVEIYINTPERSYFKVVVNPNGMIWDESTDATIVNRDTLPILWNPGVKAAIKKYPDRWTAEIMIPTKDFGKLGPTKQYPWGIQIARTRFTGGIAEGWAIAPISPYRTLNKWGNLWSR